MQHTKALCNWQQVGCIISCQLAIPKAQLPEGIVWRSNMRDAALTLPASSDTLAIAGLIFAIVGCSLLTARDGASFGLSHCLLLHIHRATEIQTMCNAPHQHRCRSSEGSLPADTHSAALVRSLSVCVSRSAIDWPCAGPW